jgi:NAD(P)-dependent dehydrogenase (short-subunit alcohol dehydrogenase family)
MSSGILLMLLLAALFPAQFVLALVNPFSDVSIPGSKNEGFRVKTLDPRLSSGCDAEVELMSNQRRKLLFEGSSATLSALILGDSAWANEVTEPGMQPQQTIVITGANSGVGFEACKRLARRGHRLVLACRTISKAQVTARGLSDYGGTLIPAECDLASLSSIQSFALQLPTLIGNSKIDCLCLNAGLCRNTAASTEIVRTADGFELTVGTNHFGHFYLNHLLLPSVDKIAGRIVVTASGVHDPESPGGAQGETATLGDLVGLESHGKDCEMIDGGKFNADKAYKDSKVRQPRTRRPAL